MNISRTASAFLKGVYFAREHAMAQDAKDTPEGTRWVTIGHTEEHKGQHVLISKKDGRIEGGLGGKFNGTKLKDLGKVEKKASAAGKAQKKSMDYSLPKKVNPEFIQNRDREGGASQEQILNISAKPDYLRLSTSNMLADGAPVVAYGKIPAKQRGRIATVTDAYGKRLQVQYAVMEADDIAASHDDRGNRNTKFYSDDPAVTRAIAGNGRIAGLQLSYERGTADEYRNDMLADDVHGIDADVIEGMKKPVLVRIMQPKDVTDDIGDRSNTASNLTMNALEQAKNDVNRLGLNNRIDTYASGAPTVEAVSDFINRLPISERGAMRDTDGTPTKQAQDRLQAALFAKAYPKDSLIRLYSQARDTDVNRLLNGMQGASAAVAVMAQDYPDIRDTIAGAAERTIRALRAGESKEIIESQPDMFKSAEDNATEQAIARIFTRSKSAKEIKGKIEAVARALSAEAEGKQHESMFAELEPLSPAEIIRATLARFDTENQ